MNLIQRLSKSRVGPLAIPLDQIAFSGAAFLLQFAAAPSSGNVDFAGFSLVTLVQIGQWYISRAAASEPLLVGRGMQGSDPAGAAQRSANTALLVGAVCTLISLVGAAAADGDLRWMFLIQAVACPITAVFDHSRYLLFASKRPVHALLLDVLWTATLAVGIAVMLLTRTLSPTHVYLMWAVAILAPTVVGFKLTGIRIPVPGRELRLWTSQNRFLVPGFVTEAAFLTFGAYLTFGVIYWVNGADALGLFRKAQLPVTVLNALMMGIATALLTHLTQRAGKVTSVKVPLLATAAGGVFALIGALIILIAPTKLVEVLFNVPWDQMRPLVFVLLLYGFMQLVAMNATTFAKAHGKSWVSPKVRAVEAVIEAILVAVFGTLFGINGVPWALVVAWALASPIAWLAAIRLTRSPADQSEQPQPVQDVIL